MKTTDNENGYKKQKQESTKKISSIFKTKALHGVHRHRLQNFEKTKNKNNTKSNVPHETEQRQQKIKTSNEKKRAKNTVSRF